jgi:hypothetical protein
MTWSQAGECCGHVFFPPISWGSNSLQAKVFQCLRCLHGAGRLETCWCCCEFTPIETSQTIQTYPNYISYIVDGQATPAHCEQSWTIWKISNTISPSHLRGPSAFQCKSWLPPGIAYGGALLRCVDVDHDSTQTMAEHKYMSHAVLVCSVWLNWCGCLKDTNLQLSFAPIQV